MAELPTPAEFLQLQSNGRTLTFRLVGRGAYPYPCDAARKYPDAAVYLCRPVGSWIHEGSPSFGEAVPVSREVAMRDALAAFGTRHPEHYPGDVREVRGQGGRLVQCMRCGAVYSAVKTGDGPDFECIERGDGWCQENYPGGDQ